MKDVVIIGGGLLGAATAYQLSTLDPSLKITLLERYDTTAQASARAACLLTRLRTKPDVAAMVEETYSAIERVESLLGESLNLQRSGSITIASSEATIASLETLADIAQKSSINYERFTKEQVKRHLPWIDTSLVERALFTRDDAFIDSALWCNGMIKEALLHGADRAVLLSDYKFAGSDRVLAAAARRLAPYRMLFFGHMAIDGDTAQVGTEVAALLVMPQATQLRSVV